MTLNDLLTDKGIEPGLVLVLRHRPSEPKLNKVLPWLAAEKPHVFNAYQQHQGKQLESVTVAQCSGAILASAQTVSGERQAANGNSHTTRVGGQIRGL